ncbi:orotidine 5'-phosphate decarboxylase [Oceanithermus profundus DSM 14977]|uniref:Orotidine 5'-phosphate decarboxylase n=1 Tax=Oceanithermus profundus (strain DSM 14977 / NBRC 100410 / VKM B-2274 / 506) TaxID=670487 RepID=E4U955_OCEP5|nr:orotidine-5'-phosphate decarboxylase [Oceanithermus profundus]ADR36885.1 orotidine 5'-phosphate decarboxylase [Oceanithermus profundus DSM 14977]
MGLDFVSEVAARPPLVLGVDPRPAWHPGPEPLEHLERYALELMETLADGLAAVKFQYAFFEALGGAGWALLERLVAAARVLGLPVIHDAKRGDIGSTAEAYARATLARWPGSALTVNPYLGGDALEPFFEAAAASGGAVFVLVKTSNPGSADFQDLDAGGRPLYLRVAERVAAWAEAWPAEAEPWSRVGAVVGGTHPEALELLRAALPRSLFLVPGLGAQGAEPRPGAGLLWSASRSLFYPGGRPDLAAARRQAEAYRRALAG